jgi:hypothetical protein
MADVYRIAGAGISPCSVKLRDHFRCKAVPQQQIF